MPRVESRNFQFWQSWQFWQFWQFWQWCERPLPRNSAQRACDLVAGIFFEQPIERRNRAGLVRESHLGTGDFQQIGYRRRRGGGVRVPGHGGSHVVEAEGEIGNPAGDVSAAAIGGRAERVVVEQHAPGLVYVAGAFGGFCKMEERRALGRQLVGRLAEDVLRER